MTPRPDLPKEIGPHEGRELELMLAGVKPLAMFSDVIPSNYEWPDALFEPHVSSGVFVKREFLTDAKDGRRKVRHLYFALPEEAWRIEKAHALSLMSFDAWCEDAEESCVQLGRLLGYGEDEIEVFIRWASERRGSSDGTPVPA